MSSICPIFGDDLQFREEKEEDLPKYHFDMGMGIRNGWELWAGSQLAKYFEEMGIFHPDDISAIILKSYHRHLNNRDIGLEEQREYLARYWINMGKNGGSVSDWDRKYFAISQRQWGQIRPKSDVRPNEKQESRKWRLTMHLRSALSKLWK